MASASQPISVAFLRPPGQATEAGTLDQHFTSK